MVIDVFNNFSDLLTEDHPLRFTKQFHALKEACSEMQSLREKVEQVKKLTGCYDTTGREIEAGHVVHWSDGGDDLSLYERIKTRWDRIAVVEKDPDIQFRVIDSPAEDTKKSGVTFHYGSFIYRNTESSLTIVADSEEEYREKFNNAGECMAFVLEHLCRAKQGAA